MFDTVSPSRSHPGRFCTDRAQLAGRDGQPLRRGHKPDSARVAWGIFGPGRLGLSSGSRVRMSGAALANSRATDVVNDYVSPAVRTPLAAHHSNHIRAQSATLISAHLLQPRIQSNRGNVRVAISKRDPRRQKQRMSTRLIHRRQLRIAGQAHAPCGPEQECPAR